MQASVRRTARRVPSKRTEGDDSWVDRVADSVQSLLAQEGLDMEMIVWYDPVTETLHAVGFDGAPARYFRSVSGEDHARDPLTAAEGKPLNPLPPSPRGEEHSPPTPPGKPGGPCVEA